jgi:cobalt-precorrin 5A hydrolase
MGDDDMRVAGIGFRGAADAAAINDALDRALAEAGGRIDALVTEAAKARAPVFREVAQARGLPGLGVRVQDIGGLMTPTQSQRIQDRFGTGSLCEAAALAAVGPGGRLVAVRVISGDGMATAAIAESEGNDR